MVIYPISNVLPFGLDEWRIVIKQIRYIILKKVMIVIAVDFIYKTAATSLFKFVYLENVCLQSKVYHCKFS